MHIHIKHTTYTEKKNTQREPDRKKQNTLMKHEMLYSCPNIITVIKNNNSTFIHFPNTNTLV